MPVGRKRVVVIGAGMVGISAASFLRRDGHEVTVIDPAGPGEGTSFGNAGCLNGSSVVPMAMPGTIRNAGRWLFDPLGPLSLRWTYLPQLAPWLVRVDERPAWPRHDACGCPHARRRHDPPSTSRLPDRGSLRPDPSRVSVWMGHRPSLPDSLPIIGQAARTGDVIYAFGHGHVGMVGAPMTGRLVASRPPAIDLGPFRAARFA